VNIQVQCTVAKGAAMGRPSDEELERAVDAVLSWVDEDAHDAAAQVTRVIQDDHFMWSVSESRVEEIIAARIAARVPPRQVPEELFQPDWGKAKAASIAPRDWENVKVEGVHHAQGGLGSSGCFLVKLSGDGFVVLKQRGMGCANDVFASKIFESVGISCPKIRILPKSELKGLTQQLRNAPVSVKGTCDQIHSSRFQEDGAMLMEFAQGASLEDKPLKESDFLTLDDPELITLGKIAFVDAILNNSDRFPTIWRGEEGNAGNLLFDWTSGTFTAIDQTTNPIHNEKLLNAYLGRLKCLTEDESVSKMCAFLGLQTGGKAYKQVSDHFIAGVGEIRATFQENGEDIVKEAVLETEKTLGHEEDFDAAQVESFCLQTLQAAVAR